MTTGVVPALMVAEVACTGTKLPACLSWWKKFTPLAMLFAAPPAARLTIMTPLSAALAWVGFPFSAPAAHLVGREQARADQGDGHADIEHVRGGGGPGLLLDRVDLVLAAAARVGRVDLDPVLLRERADD